MNVPGSVRGVPAVRAPRRGDLHFQPCPNLPGDRFDEFGPEDALLDLVHLVEVGDELVGGALLAVVGGDAQADEVPIKRKLFRGKGKETVFEIVFARKGRLYFRRTKARKVDILVIGTKNTQEKDLVYLDHL